MVSGSSWRIERGEVEANEMQSSLCSSFVEVSEIAKLTASVCNSCFSCGVVVSVMECEKVNAND